MEIEADRKRVSKKWRVRQIERERERERERSE